MVRKTSSAPVFPHRSERGGRGQLPQLSDPKPPTQNLEGWDPTIHTLTHPPGDSNTRSRRRTPQP